MLYIVKVNSLYYYGIGKYGIRKARAQKMRLGEALSMKANGYGVKVINTLNR